MRALLSTSSRAFTLIEVMVAASIGLIILLGATNIATTMVRTTRIAGDAQALTTRAQLARNLLVPMLAATGDAWRVDNAFKTPFDSTSGAPGEAHCAPSTNLCTGPQIYPLRITDGGPGGSDSVRAIVPRPGPLESVQIKTLAGGVGIPVTCAGLPNVVAFDVQGTTTVPLAVGDLVILSKRDHVTVGVLATALPADASDPPITRTLSIDVGPVAELEFDDGGRTNCSAQSSYGNAFVVPVSVIDIRHNVGAIEFAESRTAAQALAPSFIRALEGIDDFQVRLEVARFPADGEPGAATLCTCETADVLQLDTSNEQRTFGDFPGLCTCPASERFNRDPLQGPVLRAIGLQLGLLIRGDATRDRDPTVVPGMFNRTNTIATDTFVRHRATFFVGLPNAHAF